MHELARVVYPPRTITAAKPGANPTARTPNPPARNLRVAVIGVAVQRRLKRFASLQKPYVPRVKIVFVYRVVRPFCGFFGLRFDRAPEVRHVAVEIVDGF